MRKVTALIIVLCFALCFLSSCSAMTYDDRYDQSFWEGWDEGHNDGFEDGYDEGYDEGYEEGSDEGYYVGYADGECDGYYAGATYTCLFFGDVDRAFQSAINGCAWYSFVDAYDQYISDIYDDDNTRSELVWSLVSATLSEEGATKEEKELLISTFGKDLFTRNGITFD